MRIRHALPMLGLALVLGAAAIPIASLPLPVNDQWATYVNTVWFYLSPVPAATMFAHLGQRCAVTLEFVHGCRSRALIACQTLAALLLAWPAVLLPSLSRPVPHALVSGTVEYALVALVTAGFALILPWFYAWIPSAPLTMVFAISPHPQHTLSAVAAAPLTGTLVSCALIAATVILTALVPLRARELAPE